MIRFHQRLLLLGLFAVLPGCASASGLASGGPAQADGPVIGMNTPGSAHENASARITPPTQPMLYTRRMRRNLPGGAAIVVERSFAITFTPAPDGGFIVNGQQVAVSVDMPEQLASLAALERQRVESGIFPLELDASGRIVTGASPLDSPEIDAALTDVSARVANLDRSADERQTMREFIAAIHEAGANLLSVLPEDLFAPEQTDRTARREIALPDGGEGAVATHFVATRDPATGLMRSAQREVTTTIDGEQRSTVETFMLEPHPADQVAGNMLPPRKAP